MIMFEFADLFKGIAYDSDRDYTYDNTCYNHELVSINSCKEKHFADDEYEFIN
jgi:hypothetical protein